MRNAVCPHCQQAVQVPDDLAQAHCVRCGRLLLFPDTNVTVNPALPTNSQALQSEGLTEKLRSHRPSASSDLPERHSGWEEFRANSPAVQRELTLLATRPMPDLRDLARTPLPLDTPRELDNWGQPIGAIHVPGDNAATKRIAIAVILGGSILLLIVGGILIVFSLRAGGRGDENLGPALVLYGVTGIGLAAALWFTRGPASQAILWVFEEGVFLRQYRRSRVCRWDEIQDFEISTVTGRPLYWLTLSRDTSITISEGFSPDVIPLMEYTEIRMAAAQFLPRLQEICRGRKGYFGVLMLNLEGFHGPDFFVPWPAVRAVGSNRYELFVERTGSKEAMSVRYRDVSFPYLVMAISQVMIDEHDRFAKLDR